MWKSIITSHINKQNKKLHFFNEGFCYEGDTAEIFLLTVMLVLECIVPMPSYIYLASAIGLKKHKICSLKEIFAK
jgi:hypothetical protein